MIDQTDLPPSPASPDPFTPDLVSVALQSPIVRGETRYATVSLRKPRSGELRGTKLTEILQSDVATMIVLLPRITEPPLTRPEIEAMDLVDFAELSGVVIGFFMSAGQKAEMNALRG